MLGVMAIPSLIYTVLVFGVPESPRWLITIKNNLSKAREILVQIGEENPDAEIKNIISANESVEAKSNNQHLFATKYRRVLWLAFFVAFFNQWSGINFILYYAPEILESAGLGAKESLFNSIAIGGTNLIFTFVGLYLIDRIGRKKLLLIGCLGYIISLAAVAWSFYAHAGNAFLLFSLMFFIASHAVGQGAVIWVLISEIFPNNVRALGQSFGASVHWVFAALITLITPVFLDKENGVFGDNPWPIFAFFSFMMVLQLVWILTKVPETRGVSLEELEKKLIAH
jgi:sugar porter (SP) family MFS transporter